MKQLRLRPPLLVLSLLLLLLQDRRPNCRHRAAPLHRLARRDALAAATRLGKRRERRPDGLHGCASARAVAVLLLFDDSHLRPRQARATLHHIVPHDLLAGRQRLAHTRREASVDGHTVAQRDLLQDGALCARTAVACRGARATERTSAPARAQHAHARRRHRRVVARLARLRAAAPTRAAAASAAVCALDRVPLPVGSRGLVHVDSAARHQLSHRLLQVRQQLLERRREQVGTEAVQPVARRKDARAQCDHRLHHRRRVSPLACEIFHGATHRIDRVRHEVRDDALRIGAERRPQQAGTPVTRLLE